LNEEGRIDNNNNRYSEDAMKFLFLWRGR